MPLNASAQCASGMPHLSTVSGRGHKTDARTRHAIEEGVATLLRRYSLPSAAPQFGALIDLVSSGPRAPTAVREPMRVLEVHLADSLVALELPEVRNAGTIADIGAGAGFPGLPLAIALPASHVALVESNARKCVFMERAIAAAGLRNARAINARAEEWADGRRMHDLITARAVGSLAVVAEYAAPLMCVGGALVAWRGQRDPQAERIAARAAAELGLEPRDPVRVRPYPSASHRHLHVMLKVRETPERFPRRVGMAANRPLGG